VKGFLLGVIIALTFIKPYCCGKAISLIVSNNIMTKLPTPQDTEKKADRNAWIMAILSIIYTISPIDIIPDIPVIGWIDDFFVLSAAVLNLLEHMTGRTHYTLRSVLKSIKWIVIVLGIIVILLLVLIGTLIVKWLSEYI
jgi:uncharacterized membrane protein YkvA (DUF1232 family)